MAWFYVLPVAGAAIGFAYQRWGQRARQGADLILEEIHHPRRRLPASMPPLILVTTLLTHLVGGSAGREGTAVQMSAALTDQLGRFFRITAEERKTLLVASAGAGFGAAIGAPWAGALFGIEAFHRSRPSHWVHSLIASFMAYYSGVLLGAPHIQFPSPAPISWNLALVGQLSLLGLAFGLAAKFTVWLTHLVERISVRAFPAAWLRAAIGGGLLLIVFVGIGWVRYSGLGIPVILEAFGQPASLWDPLAKSVVTALTIGMGFKGGEFIPLVFIGATAGSAMAALLHWNISLAAALGVGAVFGAAANAPLACALMAAELFGWPILPAAVITGYISYLVTGEHGIYRSQLRRWPKHKRFRDQISAYARRIYSPQK